jgi:hypothetical protein
MSRDGYSRMCRRETTVNSTGAKGKIVSITKLTTIEIGATDPITTEGKVAFPYFEASMRQGHNYILMAIVTSLLANNWNS